MALERRRQLGLTQPDVAKRYGPSAALVRQVEKGTYDAAMQSSVRRGYEAALEWASGSIDAILAGGDPTPADPGSPPAGIRTDRDSINEVTVRARHDENGEFLVYGESTAMAPDEDNTSRMELRYWPGQGRTVARAGDIITVIGDAHRAALRLTVADPESNVASLKRGGDGDADSTESGGSAPTNTEFIEPLAADEQLVTIEDEQEQTEGST